MTQIESQSGTSWLSRDELESARERLPIVYVDIIPVRADEAGTVTAFSALPNTNTEWTAVTLHDGSVLGVGGGACGTPMALPSLDFLPGKPSSQ